MAKIPEKVLEWRAKKSPGEIMSPETFERIKESAKGAYKNPEAVAGAAYWKTVLAKYKKSKKPKTVVQVKAIQRKIGRGK